MGDDPSTKKENLGYVAAGKNRRRILHELADGNATPSSIRDQTDINLPQVSRTLTGLRERGLVKLLVPEDQNEGRVYGITDDGEDIASDLPRRTDS